MAEFIQKYISIYLHKYSIKTTLWLKRYINIRQNLFLGEYCQALRCSLAEAVALDGDIL